MQETKKPPLWARLVGTTIAFGIDNLWMLIFAVAACMGNLGVAGAALVMAFYTRLTEIRDAIQQSKPEITLNLKTTPAPAVKPCAEEHF